MAVPNKDYRENDDRAIYVTGRIDQGLVDRLTPQINQLRLASCDPVTAYIDSPGGFSYLAETIRRLIKAPNPDGGVCRVITVVTGTAASAAADLLALGDYSIAYPHSRILYHGSRRPAESELTYEGASSLASSLQEMNELVAVRLARCAFPRFCVRMSQFTDQFIEYTGQTTAAVMLPITTLTTPLMEKLSPSDRRLVRDAMERQKGIENLTISVAKHLSRFKKKLSFKEFEREVLRAIVSYKTKFHENDLWSLSGQGLSEITNDFKLLLDFHSGEQSKDIERFTRTIGELFLVPQERQEYEQLAGDQDTKLAWLKAHVEARLKPLWYFVVSLCRLLQMTDYFLDPEEAYWLGLVDEVCGSGLPNVRQMMESLPLIPAAAEATFPASAPKDTRAVGA